MVSGSDPPDLVLSEHLMAEKLISGVNRDEDTKNTLSIVTIITIQGSKIQETLGKQQARQLNLLYKPIFASGHEFTEIALVFQDVVHFVKTRMVSIVPTQEHV